MSPRDSRTLTDEVSRDDRPGGAASGRVEVPQGSESGRIDSWLWAVRILKTRSAAASACRAGHVRLNGTTAKASATVRAGDEIRVRQQGFDRIFIVEHVLTKRVGAPVAVQCYRETTPARPKPSTLLVPVRDRGAGRPTKKDRRELDKLRRSGW